MERTPRFPGIRLKRFRPALLWQLPWLLGLRVFGRRLHGDPRQPDAFWTQLPGDVLATFGVQTNSATVIAAAHTMGKPAVLLLGSDGDLDPRFLSDPDLRTPYGDSGPLCRWILEQADAIVCQTVDQQSRLKSIFGRDGTVIANPIDLDRWDQLSQQPSLRPLPAEPFVLWIGRAESVHKRPQECVEIARRCPAIPFVMVLNPRDATVEREVRTSAPGNVQFISTVPPADMPAILRRASLLLNTSSLEGFSNAFLEAAAARIPVLTLEVGTNYFRQSQAGDCVQGDLDRAAAVIQEWSAAPEKRLGMGQAGRDWVTRHHSARAQAAELWSFFGSVRRAVHRQESPLG